MRTLTCWTVVSLVVAGCAPERLGGKPATEADRNPEPSMVPDSAPAGSLRFEIDLPPRVAVGEPVPITLRATNAGDDSIDLYLRGREIAFDITVASETGEIVWRRLEGQTVPAILQIRTLEPGESLELNEVWNQETNAGTPAKPGLYAVKGTFPGESRRPATTPAAPLRIIARD
jgi:hypothetical protein